MKWIAAGVVLVGSVGCGEVKDAAPDAATATADAPPNRACDPSKPFAAPTQLRTLNSGANDFYARVSADGRYVFLSAEAGGHHELAQASRASVDADFGAPTKISELNTVSNNSSSPTLSRDQLRMYFANDIGRTQGEFQIVGATRPNVAAAWGTPVSLGVGMRSDSPYLAPDDSALYFTRAAPPASFDLHVASAAPGGGFGSPAALTELNSDVDEVSPVVTEDQLTIYFARGTGNVSTDIYVARRTSLTAAFSPPTVVSELSTASGYDMPTSISPDGCTLYFVSNGYAGGPGNLDIWVARKPQ